MGSKQSLSAYQILSHCSDSSAVWAQVAKAAVIATIENIDACLSFLAAKGVNIQGLSSEEIRNGNLKAILGLFFSLSRYKQQQQQAQRQNPQPSYPPTAQPQGTHPPLSQQSSAPAQLSHSTHGTAALAAQKAAQAEMQSRDGSKLLKFSLGQKKTSRLPGPSARVSTAGGDIPTRGSVSAAGNRRSQGFSDKTKANLNKAPMRFRWLEAPAASIVKPDLLFVNGSDTRMVAARLYSEAEELSLLCSAVLTQAHRSPSALNEGQCAVQFQGLAQGCTGWVISLATFLPTYQPNRSVSAPVTGSGPDNEQLSPVSRGLSMSCLSSSVYSHSSALDSSEGMTSQPSVMTEHAPSSAVTISSSTSIPAATSAQIPPPSSSSSSSTAIPQPNSNSKPWRSKSVSSKHISTSSSSISTAASAMQSAKQDKDSSCKADAPPKVVAQKSMLEKLKLFNSKGSSKSSASSSNGAGAQAENAALARQLAAAQLERSETGSNTDPLEEVDGNVRPGMNGTSNGTAYGAAPSAATTVSTTASSPKMALRGIAQRTFSRALTAKKSSVKSTEKDKDRGKEKEKEKEKGKELGKRISAPDRTELRGDELKEEAAPVTADTDGSNKRTSKITSFIPKGGKVSKKESSTPAHSGIPKPGSKAPGVGGKASSVKEAGERPRSMRLGGGLAMHRGPMDRDSRHSSSTSSLASTEGKACASSGVGGGSTQSTASNTISVQLPQTQQHHSHPNTATVAPFMYRYHYQQDYVTSACQKESQTDGLDTEDTESGSGGRGGDVSFTKSSQLSIEDLSGEDPETRRLRTVKNIADLRQNLEETMSSLRGTQVSHSTLETTFDGSVTTDISSSSGGGSAVSNNSGAGSRSILSITSSRPSLSSWRLGQSSPRLQAGDAPSLGNSYGGGRVAGSQGGRYLYPGNLRRQLAGRGGAIHSVELGDRAGEDTDLDSIAVDVTGYMSDGDVLTKNAARTDDVASGDSMTDDTTFRIYIGFSLQPPPLFFLSASPALRDKTPLLSSGVGDGVFDECNIVFVGKKIILCLLGCPFFYGPLLFTTGHMREIYMTDGGLGMYTRRLNRLPDSMAAVRETLHRNTSSGQGDADRGFAQYTKEMSLGCETAVADVIRKGWENGYLNMGASKAGIGSFFSPATNNTWQSTCLTLDLSVSLLPLHLLPLQCVVNDGTGERAESVLGYRDQWQQRK
ncbi:hypothetical protein NQZ68_039883 [Dissostichus eleginoides]|nr:hypothetical protein NQZ68_039883 [Dissostichus eleginoides]